MEKNKSIDGLFTRQAKSDIKLNSVSVPVKIKSEPKSIKIEEPAKTVSLNKVVTKKTVVKTVDEKISDLKISDTNLDKNPIEEKETSVSINEDFLKPVQAFDFDSKLEKQENSEETKEEPEKKPEEESKNPEENPNEEPKKSKKEKRKKKPVSKARKIITSILLIIVLALIGGVTYVVFWGNDIIAKITGGQGNVLDFIAFVGETYEDLKTDSNGRTNILAFGTSGYDMEGSEGDGYHAGSQLTDSIMVISMNQKNGDIVMLSLPRDLKASPTCTATGKINEVYWCNNISGDDEEGGATALMNEVGDILGLEFQYYAHVNWESLIAIVDSLGGIEITLDEDINDYYYTGAVYEAGVTYTINGEEALGIARARHGTSGGDFSRGASQQKILIGIKDKLLANGLGISEILNLANVLGDNLRTNFSLVEMKTLAHYATYFDFDSMRQVSLIDPYRYMVTGTLDNGISYVFPYAGVGNYDEIQEYVAKMFSNDPRDYEEYSILVLNGTEVSGLASTEKATLIEKGYSNIYTDNAPEGEYTRDYIIYATNDSAPNTKLLLEDTYDLFVYPADEIPEGISRDYTFIIIIGGHTTEATE